ncbi:hypothetical protein DICPUDRAFT_42599 [Dictyostelium purpureum]|uniref:Enoyl reductase (ER) domain-containing protein n=1 Tax=Dictyostelium purpureum TaxID=5786 RepID=F1A2F2_DICPU|nr:uncharacterized protein DICPUDRAFT_42599 [Dictyostelium purpureum]EGC29626.1 hypothetical protein DICPUDRAFT_42599 [Dictyostelium purpureum]|eukprot:XP_003293844.1 hypothetical protein DICPUDRAFT_42599 [Dictyostelium purpureum]
MKGVFLDRYGESLDNLSYKTDIPVYNPQKSQVLIKVKSTSINPLDNVMRKGYAQSIVDLKLKLPYILGRECSGEIVRMGDDVWDFEVGDQVWSATAPFSNGSHCEYVLVNESEISKKPKNLSYQEAASIPFTSLTAWNAIFNVSATVTPEKRVLVNGGNGGVGFFIINLLKKHLGVHHVTATCRPQHFEKLKLIAGADQTIDYNEASLLGKTDTQLYDIVFNCVDGGEAMEFKCVEVLKNGGNLIGFNGPMVRYSDKDGILQGLTMGVMESNKVSEKIKQKFNKSIKVDYTLFTPSGETLKEISKLYENKILLPNIDKQFHLSDIKSAYQCFESSSSNGKVIINI